MSEQATQQLGLRTFIIFTIQSDDGAPHKFASREFVGVLVPLQIGSDVLVSEEIGLNLIVQSHSFCVESLCLEYKLKPLILENLEKAVIATRQLEASGWVIS